MNQSVAALLLLCGLLLCCSALNERPVVGVLTQPNDLSETAGPESLRLSFSNSSSNSYIAASYVKYLEASGALVVPVFHDAPLTVLKELASQLSGVLLPGGGIDPLKPSALYDSAKFFVEYALENPRFVVLGHCQGFELITMIGSGDLTRPEAMTFTDAENISMPLRFADDWKESRWFADMPQDIHDILSTKNVTLNNHSWGITPKQWAANAKLNSQYRYFTTDYDRKGKEFISTFEHKTRHIYAMQWHAEKNLFEHLATEDIPHTAEAVRISQWFSRFAIDRMRENPARFATAKAEAAALIYNYNPVYSISYSPFEQVYLFPPYSQQS